MDYRCNKWNKIHKDYKDYSSGNKIVDEFIRYTQINDDLKAGRMKFAPYNQFKNVKYFAEGGFSKLYKATWIIWTNNRKNKRRKRRNYKQKIVVALKRLHGSKNITSKD